MGYLVNGKQKVMINREREHSNLLKNEILLNFWLFDIWKMFFAHEIFDLERKIILVRRFGIKIELKSGIYVAILYK